MKYLKLTSTSSK